MKRPLFIFAGLLLAMFVVISCSLQMPGMPIWSIEVNIPFSQRTYRLAELLTDSTRMAEDGYGIIYGRDGAILQFEYRDTLDFKPIGERMDYTASDTSSFINEIGLLIIEASNPDTTLITIVDALSEDVVDSQGIIDPFDLPVTENTLRYDIFEWVKVNEGMMRLELVNGFPFPIENITLSVDNYQEGTHIGTVSFPGPIAKDSILIDSLSLRRHFLHNELKITIAGHASGSPDLNVRIRGDEAITVISGISELSADSAYAEIQPQNSLKTDTLNYDDPNCVKEAVIASGWAYLEIQNITPAKLTSVTSFRNIFSPDDEVLTQIVTIDPGTPGNPTTLRDSVDLRDHSVRMSIDEQIVPVMSEFQTEDTRETMYQGSSLQKITKYQGIEGEAWTSKLIFKVFTGIIDSVHFGFTEEETDFDLPEGTEDIEFTRDTLFVNTNNNTTLPMQMDVTLTAVNFERDTSVSVHVIDAIETGSDVIAVPDCDGLLRILPNSIKLVGWTQMGARFFPEYSDVITTLYDTTGVSIDVNLSSELRLIVYGTTVESDPQLIEQALDYPVESAQIQISLTNSIPLSGNMMLLMGTDTTLLDTIIDAFIPVGRIVNHRAEVVEASYTIDLEEAKLDIIMQPDVYTKQVIQLESTQGDTVWLYGADSLDVSAKATINYIIDPGNNLEQ